MKKLYNTKKLLAQALTQLPDDHNITKIKLLIKAALKEIENIEIKSQKKTTNSTGSSLSSTMVKYTNSHVAMPAKEAKMLITTLEKMIESEKKNLENYKKANNKDDNTPIQTFHD